LPQERDGYERIAFWDNVKGYLIVLVVIGHYLYAYWGTGTADLIVKMIYYMHMPAFAFVSGFLSKSEHSRSIASVSRLIVFYLIFNLFMMLFGYFFMHVEFSLITPANSFWFLLSLITWRLTAGFIAKIKGIEWFGFLAALLIGFWKDVGTTLAINRTIAFFPFFIIGYKLSGKKLYTYLQNRRPIDFVSGGALLFVTLGISAVLIKVLPGLGQSHFVMNSYNKPTDIIIRVLIFLVSAFSIGALIMTAPGSPVPLLSKWGKNSLAIYVLHRFLTFIFNFAFPPSSYRDGYLPYALAASIVTLFVLGTEPVSHRLNTIAVDMADAYIRKDTLENDRNKKIFRRIMACVMIAVLFLPVFPQILGLSRQ
jgi:fucose 4-O-acetylase-like acetyltransferase